MDLPDVNVLVYAVDTASPFHRDARQWLDSLTLGSDEFAYSELVLSSFVRVTIHPRILARPLTLEEALRFCSVLRGNPLAQRLMPGSQHWDLFDRLSRHLAARSNQIPDICLASLAIEHGVRLVSADQGFARFPGLRWHNPLQTIS